MKLSGTCATYQKLGSSGIRLILAESHRMGKERIAGESLHLLKERTFLFNKCHLPAYPLTPNHSSESLNKQLNTLDKVRMIYVYYFTLLCYFTLHYPSPVFVHIDANKNSDTMWGHLFVGSYWLSSRNGLELQIHSQSKKIQGKGISPEMYRQLLPSICC